MNDPRRQTLMQALWPQDAKSRLGVWGILDCARDPKIYLALIESRLEFRCLYSGRLPRALEINAPQLVELLPGHRLTEKLLDPDWGQFWGVLLKISDPSNLRHHLRKLLKVECAGGRPALFRFYDPRVLGAFLPQARPEQLREFFGPLAVWYAEDGLGGWAEFRCDPSWRLQKRQVLSPPLPAILNTE